MKKVLSFLFLLCLFSVYGFSQSNENISVTIEVTNITINGGRVYLIFFSNADSFKNEKPEFAYEIQDNSASASVSVSIPPGEYIVSAFQDANNNQQLDYGLFGRPKELVGISNYFGRGLPSKDFNRQKIMLNSATGKVNIHLYKF